MQQSEVARTRHQIDLEEQSARRMSDFAAVAKHKRITQRALSLAELVAAGKLEEAFERWNAGAS